MDIFYLLLKFSNSRICIDNSWSYIGREAESVKKEKCTMQLDLSVTGPGPNPENYKKWTVLHETGHALGFGHEHQHPDHATDIFNEDVVIDYLKNHVFYDRKKATQFFDKNYKNQGKEDDAIIFPFDKESVMRYWYEGYISDFIIHTVNM